MPPTPSTSQTPPPSAPHGRPSDRRRGKGCIAILLFLLLIVGAAIGAYFLLQSRDLPPPPGGGGTDYRVRFQESRDLAGGDSIVCDGEVVGRVLSVAPEPTDGGAVIVMRLEPRFADEFGRSPSVARVVSLADGATAVEVSLPGKTFAESGRELAEKSWEEARGGLDTLLESAREGIVQARDWAQGADAQELRAKAEGLDAKLREFSKLGQEKANEALQETITKGQELVDELKAKGEQDVAGKLTESLEKLKIQAEELAEKGKGLLQGGEEESDVRPVQTDAADGK